MTKSIRQLRRQKWLESLSRRVERTNRPPGPRFSQRVLFLLIGTAIFLTFLVGFSGDAWPAVVYGLLTDGALALLWLIAATGVGSLIPLPLQSPTPHEAPPAPPRPHPALRFATAAALGLGIFSLLALALGLAGLLNRATAWGLIAAGCVAGAVTLLRRYDRSTFEHDTNAWISSPVRWGWLWLVAVPTLALVCVAAMVPPGVLWAGGGGAQSIGDPHGYDVVEYHLQIPREWFEAGKILPLEHNVFSYFPFSVEMHYLLAMHLRGGPWAGMYLAQFMHATYILLTVVALYALARRLGASAAAATACGLAGASTPWLWLLAPVAYNEGGLLLYGTLALGWSVLAVAEHTHRLTRFALAGALAGFACGCKLTAVPTVLLAIAGIAALMLIASREAIPMVHRLRQALAGPVLFGLVGVAVFSPWLIRNAVWTGNPVFPEAMPLLGQGHFSDVQVERWQRAHRPREDERSVEARLKLGWERIIIDWRHGWLILPLGVILGMAYIRRPGALMLLLVMVSLAIFWLAITHLQSRFFVLGVPVAALLLAHVRWKAWPVVAATLFAVISVLGWTRAYEAAKFVVGNAGLEDFEPVMELLLPRDALDRVRRSPRVTLIGDARAFWYPIPMSRLRYRTVFDADTSAGEDVLSAWTANEPPVTGEVRLVDPAELRRFAQTYWRIPNLPSGLRERNQPFELE